MGFAEGSKAGSTAYAVGVQSGIEQGRMFAEAGERIGDAIEKTRALLLRREQDKDAERRAPEIENQLKEIRKPYLMKQQEIQAAMKQLRLDPDSIDRRQMGVLIEEGLAARIQMNDASLQLLMGVSADANPVLAARFKPHTSAAFQAWENDAAVFENMTKSLAEEEWRETQAGIERHKAESMRISALADRTKAEAEGGLTPPQVLKAILESRDSAVLDFENMPPEVSNQLVERAKKATGRDDITIHDVRKNYVDKLTRSLLRTSGFEGFEEPEAGKPREVQAFSRPESPRSTLFQDAKGLARWIYGELADTFSTSEKE